MIVQCSECKAEFEDNYRNTICPHNAFTANDGNNNFTVHEEAYLKTMNYTKAACGHQVVAEGAPGSDVRTKIEKSLCKKCCPYDADYFLRGQELGISGYTDYHWKPELTTPMVCAIASHLSIDLEDKMLDFGCARGYIVKAFHQRGYNIWGYDTSQWAYDNADEEIKKYLMDPKHYSIKDVMESKFDWVIAKDVLEHVGDVGRVISLLKSARKGIFVVVPLSECTNGTHPRGEYDVPEYEKDITHIHRRSLQWWVGQFHQPGWVVEGRYRVSGVKDNYAMYPTGNGFIVARRIG